MKTPEGPAQEVMSMIPPTAQGSPTPVDPLDKWAQTREKRKLMEFGPNVKPLKLEDRVVTNWSDPAFTWHGEAMLQCFSANFQGKRQTDMLRNLEHVRPAAAQGVEVWFRVIREARGAAGPRLIRLAADIFHPSRAKLDNDMAALEA